MSGSTGRTSFVERHGLWGDGDAEAAAEIGRQIAAHGLEVVRFSFPDQHGILRGKAIMAGEVEAALGNGVSMTSTLLVKDTAHKTVPPVFSKDLSIGGLGAGAGDLAGAADFLMVADPKTFHVLPWAPGTGWVLCDIRWPDGRPIPYATRDICRNAVADIEARGFDYLAGIEVEFHIFRLLDARMDASDAGQPAAPPEVGLLTHGYQYLTEIRLDELDPILAILRRDLVALGLPLRSLEVEFGPSQVELTFQPMGALESADMMVLFRNATKQICARNGYHATFMCRPAIENVFSSGWHLHQSLIERATGANAFMPGAADEGALLSPTGRHFAAGILEHARAASVFTTPTINGYKRFKPYSLAPDRAAWARDNRGAMLRIISGAGEPASRIENRAGEPAANPYLYIASQILSGLDGLDRAQEPPPPTETPYDTDAPPMPASLIEAIAALRANEMFASRLGAEFIDYICMIKQAEISRYLSDVTDWEQREYFRIF